MDRLLFIISYFVIEALRNGQCQDDRPPPAYIASSHNKPVQLQPIMSDDSYNLFDSLILGLGWFVPLLTIGLLGLCLLGLCGYLERSLTKKPEARLYYAAPGGSSFHPMAQSKSGYSYDGDDSIAKAPLDAGYPVQQYGYNDPAPEYPEQQYGYNDPAPQYGYNDSASQYAEGGYRPGSPEAYTDGAALYKPNDV